MFDKPDYLVKAEASNLGNCCWDYYMDQCLHIRWLFQLLAHPLVD